MEPKITKILHYEANGCLGVSVMWSDGKEYKHELPYAELLRLFQRNEESFDDVSIDTKCEMWNSIDRFIVCYRKWGEKPTDPSESAFN